MIRDEDGFSSPLAISVIFSLCILICSLCLLLYVVQKKVNAYENYYNNERKVNLLCEEFIKDFQIIKDDEFDSYQSYGFVKLLSEYSNYQIQMKDISTGINLKFLKNEIKDNSTIKYLVDNYGDEIITEYGWINPKYTENDILSVVRQNFDKDYVYPLMNELPLYNLYFMNRDFIQSVLKLCEIKNVEEKTDKLQMRIESENLSKSDLAFIFEKDKNEKIFDFLGTKTNFWNVKLNAFGFDSELVIAAVPEKENSKKIEKYILLEKNLTYRGNLL